MDSALVNPYMRWYMWAMSLTLYEWYRDEAQTAYIQARGDHEMGWEQMTFFAYRVWRN